MRSYTPSVWKQAPFIRLLPPLIAGIIVQYYFPLPLIAGWRLAGIALCGLTLYSLFTSYTRFALQWLTGACVHLLLFSAGVLLTYYKDSSPLAQKVASFCETDEYHTAGPPETIAAILENPSEKKSSWKTLATIRVIHKQPFSIHSDTLSAAYRKNNPPDPSAPQNTIPTNAPAKLSSENHESKPLPHHHGCSMINCGKIIVYFLKQDRLPKRTTGSAIGISNHWSGAPLPNGLTASPARPSPDSPVGKMPADNTDRPYPPASKRTQTLSESNRIKVYTDNPYPRYGSLISFNKPLQPIKNFMPQGPGSFDYRRYCAFAGIHFQVFLRPGEFTVLSETHSNALQALLIRVREKIISIIQKYIPGKKEQGLAEALLIGYKDDLDKSLLQSYSNTGVVHVIAISGLHLGLIYALLKTICLPVSRLKKGRWMEPLIILTGLWLFSLLAGGSPSVLRSAVMFSFIVLGKSISRETAIFNNLAASAFALLCYHPYWLWDVGFQLSYAALTGIVIFMKPVYQLLSFKNPIADAAWKLNAVTIAAQWLTLPLILFYFRQFPNLFILTNFIAVPLSSIILIGELLLCALSWFHPVATLIGWALHWMIWLMNASIQYLEKIPFSTWKDISISLPQAILLYAIIFYGRALLSKMNTHK